MPARRLRPSALTGLLMAVAATLIVTGVIMFVAVGNRPAPRPAAIPGEVIDIGAPPKTSGAVHDVTSGVPGSGAARLQFADKKDPTRLQSELSFDKLDPVGNGYYTLDQPRAWIYTRDHRTLFITAAAGRVKMPGKAQQPEAGEFSGGVVIRLFPPPPDEQPDRPVDPEHDAPAMLATMQTLAFDAALLELSTDDPITISSPAMLFNGRGLLIRGNEVKERIEYLKTNGESLRYNPSAAQRRGSAKSESSAKSIAGATSAAGSAPEAALSLDVRRSAPNDPAQQPSTATTTSARETLYKAVASGKVRLTQTTRELAADTLEIWSRVIDNQIPEDAFSPLEFASAGTPAPAKATDPASAGEPASPPQQTAVSPATPASPSSASASLFVTAGDADIVLSWTGPLVLAPIATGPGDQPPEQLTPTNHFAARFSAAREDGEPSVRMIDRRTRAAAACKSIEYLATERNLRLLSEPGKTVVLDYPGAGQLSAPSLTVNLGSGVGHVDGGGSLVAGNAGAIGSAAPPDTSPSRAITWAEQADFQFRTIDSRLSGVLDWAAFTGTVVARDRTSTIGGDFLRAEFVPAPDASGQQISSLRKLKVDGNVSATSVADATDSRAARAGSQPDSFMSAESLEVSFAPTQGAAEEVEPTFALATGAGPDADAGKPRLARVGNRDGTLSAAKIETRFGRDERANLTATDMVATASAPGAADASFERRDAKGTTLARADRIRADGRARTAELTGESVRISGGTAAASTITGTRVRLDEVRGTLIVDGAGAFEHLQSDEENVQFADASGDGGAQAMPGSKLNSATRITATWAKGMAFDNKRGEITCEGQCVLAAAAPLSTNTLKSEKLVINITPDAGAASSSSAPGPTPLALDGRQLLRADATGSILTRADGANATVESRRYTRPPTAPASPGDQPVPNAAAAITPADPAAPVPGRILEQVMYIEGPRIMDDETTGMMSVPAAGRAIVRDQRADPTPPIPNDDKPATPGAAPATAVTSRGTSGFTWSGSMDFNRRTGVLTMRRDVELVHVALDNRQKTRMVASELAATFATENSPSAPRSSGDIGDPRADLLHAEATGAVYAESGPMKLVSDRFRYDAQRGLAEATATPGNRVTLYDDRKPIPVVARRLLWDLARDRVEITEPAPIVAPR